MKTFIILLGLLFISACATTRSYEDKLLSWKGQNVQTLIKKWGPPVQTLNLADGGKVLSYRQREEGNKKFGSQMAREGEKANVLYDCKTEILVDPTDIIIGWKFDGPNCRAK
mgnify:CR=1 FL=1